MASQLDQEFPSFAHLFEVPTLKSLGISETDTSESLYFCGNSLGLMPKSTRQAVNDELDAWASRGVESHFNHTKTSWVDIDLPAVPLMANLVGAKSNEVAIMGTLTMNLNSLLCAFYRPKGKKRKILFEKQAFPSDYYAFLNQAKMHGGDETDLLQLSPQEGSTHLETSDILRVIEEKADEIALVCFSGIQYYSGQFFEMEKITKCAKANNCVVGWDLAHAVGNVELKLHDWDVDFACWCSYKYLNSGPGSIAGIFVNEKCGKDVPRLAGWWGNNAVDRFKMLEQFDPIEGALGFRQSNPSVIDVVSLHNSLKIFEKAGGMTQLRRKGLQMSIHLQKRLEESPFYGEEFRIISPLDPLQRGCQISLFFESKTMEEVFQFLHSNGVICDERRPNVIRIAPAPLYNTFAQIDRVVGLINMSFM